MPSPGAPFPTGHLYIEVLASEVRQQTPDFTIFASPQPYMTIEHYLKGRGILGTALKDYQDGSRVYRIPNTARGHFPENPCKPGEFYLPVGNDRFVILSANPGTGKPEKTDHWVPIG